MGLSDPVAPWKAFRLIDQRRLHRGTHEEPWNQMRSLSVLPLVVRLQQKQKQEQYRQMMQWQQHQKRLRRLRLSQEICWHHEWERLWPEEQRTTAFFNAMMPETANNLPQKSGSRVGGSPDNGRENPPDDSMYPLTRDHFEIIPRTRARKGWCKQRSAPKHDKPRKLVSLSCPATCPIDMLFWGPPRLKL